MPEREFESLKRSALEKSKDTTQFEKDLYGILATAFDGAEDISDEDFAKSVVAVSYKISPELLRIAEDVRIEMGRNSLKDLEKAIKQLRKLDHDQLSDVPFCRGLAYAYLDALKREKSE